MKNAQAIISEKGQITVPKSIRDRLGLKPGQILDFETQGGRMIAKKKGAGDSLDEVVGLLKNEIHDVDDYVEKIRGR